MSGIEFRNVVKSFSGTKANDCLSFHASPGQVFGFLGPNGSGKTTSIKIMTGLLSPESGEVFLDNYNPIKDWKKVRARIGLVPQETSLYPELSAYQNLEFYASLFMSSVKHVKTKITEILEMVDLTKRAADHVNTYSGGMKRRLAIGRALLHDPSILLLDEPTLGVDVQGSHKIWEYIRSFAKEGKTVLVTTNVMSEADFLCDNLLILDNGKKIASGSPDELKKSLGIEEKVVHLKPSLDDVFLHYTGRNLRD